MKRLLVWNGSRRVIDMESPESREVTVTQGGDLIIKFWNNGAAALAQGTWTYFEFDVPEGVDSTPAP